MRLGYGWDVELDVELVGCGLDVVGVGRVSVAGWVEGEVGQPPTHSPVQLPKGLFAGLLSTSQAAIVGLFILLWYVQFCICLCAFLWNFRNWSCFLYLKRTI